MMHTMLLVHLYKHPVHNGDKIRASYESPCHVLCSVSPGDVLDTILSGRRSKTQEEEDADNDDTSRLVQFDRI